MLVLRFPKQNSAGISPCPYQSVSLLPGISSWRVKTAARDSRSTAILRKVKQYFYENIRGAVFSVIKQLLTIPIRSNVISISWSGVRLLDLKDAFRTDAVAEFICSSKPIAPVPPFLRPGMPGYRLRSCPHDRLVLLNS